MNQTLNTHINNLWTTNRDLQNAAYYYLIEATEKPIDWAYEIWDEVVANLKHPDNHNRAIAAQLICNLAGNDPEKRIVKDFGALLEVTRDERFVTARHALQALWKVGKAGAEQQALLINGFNTRYQECVNERNTTLIRFDIIQGMWNLYDATADQTIKVTAEEWIALELDEKYRKKYARVWK